MNKDYCIKTGDQKNRCNNCCYNNYGYDCHNKKIHFYKCGHRATFPDNITNIFGKPNYEKLSKEDCYDCHNNQNKRDR